MSRLIVALALLLLIFPSACVEKGLDEPPIVSFQPSAELKTISYLHELYDGDIMEITDTFAITGVVVMGEEYGNLYKQVVLQDETSGIFLILNASRAVNQGDSVVINCNGLYLDDYNGLLQLGAQPYTDNSGNFRVNGFNIDLLGKVYARGVSITSKVLSIDELDEKDYQGQLVTIEHIEFLETLRGRKYADAENDIAKNRVALDCLGNEITVRTSGYAFFADAYLPEGNGSITGVVSVYLDTKQLLVRTLDEVDMEYTRCEDGGGVDGNVLLYQNFNSLERYGVFDIPQWQAIKESGSENWQGDGYNGQSAEISAYGSGEASNVSWLVSPQVDLSNQANVYLDFVTGYKYFTHDILEVMISEDYDGISDPWDANWISLEATIATDGDPYYDQDGGYIHSGDIDLSTFLGSITVAFKYSGSGTSNKTTKYRVDNVRITAK